MDSRLENNQEAETREEEEKEEDINITNSWSSYEII